nr:MAG TPA: hypothetical protein [Caudoviricetes sp.]
MGNSFSFFKNGFGFYQRQDGVDKFLMRNTAPWDWSIKNIPQIYKGKPLGK